METNESVGTVDLRKKEVVLFAEGNYPQQTFIFLTKHSVAYIEENGKKHLLHRQRRGTDVTWLEFADGEPEPRILNSGDWYERLSLANRLMDYERNRAVFDRFQKPGRKNKSNGKK